MWRAGQGRRPRDGPRSCWWCRNRFRQSPAHCSLAAFTHYFAPPPTVEAGARDSLALAYCFPPIPQKRGMDGARCRRSREARDGFFALGGMPPAVRRMLATGSRRSLSPAPREGVNNAAAPVPCQVGPRSVLSEMRPVYTPYRCPLPTGVF